jgi:hypothetical protein
VGRNAPSPMLLCEAASLRNTRLGRGKQVMRMGILDLEGPRRFWGQRRSFCDGFGSPTLRGIRNVDSAPHPSGWARRPGSRQATGIERDPRTAGTGLKHTAVEAIHPSVVVQVGVGCAEASRGWAACT